MSFMDENLRRWNKLELLKRAIITEWYHNLSLTVASTSGVVVLNVL